MDTGDWDEYIIINAVQQVSVRYKPRANVRHRATALAWQIWDTSLWALAQRLRNSFLEIWWTDQNTNNSGLAHYSARSPQAVWPEDWGVEAPQWMRGHEGRAQGWKGSHGLWRWELERRMAGTSDGCRRCGREEDMGTAAGKKGKLVQWIWRNFKGDFKMNLSKSSNKLGLFPLDSDGSNTTTFFPWNLKKNPTNQNCRNCIWMLILKLHQVFVFALKENN